MKKPYLLFLLLLLAHLHPFAQESGIPKGVYIGYTKSIGNSFNVPIKDGFQVEYLNDRESILDFSFPFTFARSYAFTDILGQNVSSEVLSLDALLNYTVTNSDEGLTPKLYAGPGVLYETSGQAVATIVLGAKLEFPILPQKYDLVLGFQHRIGLDQGNQQTAVRIGIQSRINAIKEESTPLIEDDDLDGIPNEQDQCPFNPGRPELFGCPEKEEELVLQEEETFPESVPEVITQEEELPATITLPGDVYFAPNESLLSPSLCQALDEVKRGLLAYPNLSVLIKGHTDSRGSAGENQELSKKRARICYEYLRSQNIDAYRMNYFGYGEERPIATNKYEWGRRKNRRVEFEFYQKQN